MRMQEGDAFAPKDPSKRREKARMAHVDLNICVSSRVLKVLAKERGSENSFHLRGLTPTGPWTFGQTRPRAITIALNLEITPLTRSHNWHR